MKSEECLNHQHLCQLSLNPRIIEPSHAETTMGLRVATEESSAILYMPLVTNVSFRCLNLLEREIPRDVFIKYRNENMRKNHLDEIAKYDPVAA